MHANVTKCGNSLGVRIPRVLADKIGLHAGTPVEVSVQAHHIIIRKGYSLESMLEQITPQNTHEEVQVEPLCGKEAW